MSWRRDFPHYQVPAQIQGLVDKGLLKDASAPEDPAPSFIAKLTGGGWLRLWVEHPDFDLRRAGPFRYRVEITMDLADYGRLLIQDDSLEEIWATLHANIMTLGIRSRFRLMGGGSRKPYVQEYDFGQVHTVVSYSGNLGRWYYFRIGLSAPGITAKYVTYPMGTYDFKQAAMGLIRTLYNAYLDPSLTIAKTVEQGGPASRPAALSTVRWAEEIGEEFLAPAYQQATQEWFGYVEEEKTRGPREWFPRPKD